MFYHKAQGTKNRELKDHKEKSNKMQQYIKFYYLKFI